MSKAASKESVWPSYTTQYRTHAKSMDCGGVYFPNRFFKAQTQEIRVLSTVLSCFGSLLGGKAVYKRIKIKSTEQMPSETGAQTNL